MDLLLQFKNYIKKENLFTEKDKLLLAVSGGVDSVVLCELCYRAGYDFVIAHCNFQLRGEESDRDELFVKNLAEKYKVPYFIQSFDTRSVAASSKRSIETTARELRYEWFNEILKSSQLICEVTQQPLFQTPPLHYILTAHQADDNIETAVMNFFRGTGIAGIRGILPKQGKIIRPLLFARRKAIEEFAKEHQLDFVTDSSNTENEFTRNFFRNQIIPLIKTSFPEAEKNVLNNIERFKEVEILYQQSIEQIKKKLVEHSGNEIHIPVLKLLKTKPLATVVYEIIKEVGFTAHQTAEVIDLLSRATGKFIQSATHRIIKNRNWLIIAPVKTMEAQNILIEEGDERIHFAGGILNFKKIPALNFQHSTSIMIAQMDADQIKYPLLLRKWKQGDYFYPFGTVDKLTGKIGKKKLNRFFTNQKLSKTEKESVWVIEMDKKITWVVGMRLDNRFRITSSTKEILSIQFIKNGDEATG